ncbi:MAG TPA: SHOCT domain-containing protein [Candidatus Mediterraneibacter cottocaccae]|nr:SHOCT domain-containing protein [Candidatus Mediterraneibacter cottocaccae]
MSKNIRVKPGKTQSKAGMAAGVLFCLIGVFVVIPTFGMFGIIWTVFALIITIINGINAFSDRGVPSHEIIIEDGEDPGISEEKTENLKTDIEERLQAAKSLYESGTITEEEYEQKRREILGRL